MLYEVITSDNSEFSSRISGLVSLLGITGKFLTSIGKIYLKEKGKSFNDDYLRNKETSVTRDSILELVR